MGGGGGGGGWGGGGGGGGGTVCDDVWAQSIILVGRGEGVILLVCTGASHFFTSCWASRVFAVRKLLIAAACDTCIPVSQDTGVTSRLYAAKTLSLQDTYAASNTERA
eukprot:COSAG01_NODE_7424_length_3214_cov_2.336116_4_plen_108_part_00